MTARLVHPGDSDTTFYCTRCKQVRPRSDFSPRAPSGRQTRWCKACYRDRRKQCVTHPETGEAARRNERDGMLRRVYGIGIAEYDALYAKQQGRCAICRQEPNQRGGRGRTTLLSMMVDHDHVTGQVRGLLCNDCNQGLGRFRDDPALLRAALLYLTEAVSIH